MQGFPSIIIDNPCGGDNLVAVSNESKGQDVTHLATLMLAALEMYCVPFELGAGYQELNGWSYERSTRDERTTRIDHWTNATGETMRTVYVANMPDPETGRHFDAMCQTR